MPNRTTHRLPALAALCVCLFIGSGCGRGRSNPSTEAGTRENGPAGVAVPAAAPSSSSSGAVGADPLRGTWDVVGFAHRGRSAPARNLKGQQFIFDGNRLTMLTSPGSKQEYLYNLPAGSEPVAIEATPLVGGTKGNPLRGIIRLQGGELTIALNMKMTGSERPKDFESRFESPEVMVWVLKQARP